MTSAMTDLPELPPVQDWLDKAQCRGMGNAIFYPERGRNAIEAKATCIGCPVKLECAQDAVDIHLLYGTFGGMTAMDRRKWYGKELPLEAVQLPIKEAITLLRNAGEPAPKKTLALRLYESQEWVEEMLATNPDLMIA